MLLSMRPHPPVLVQLWLLSWTSPILGTQLLSLLHMKKYIYLKVIPTVVVVVETSYEDDSFIWVKITGYVSKKNSVSSVRFCRSRNASYLYTLYHFHTFSLLSSSSYCRVFHYFLPGFFRFFCTSAYLLHMEHRQIPPQLGCSLCPLPSLPWRSPHALELCSMLMSTVLRLTINSDNPTWTVLTVKPPPIGWCVSGWTIW